MLENYDHRFRDDSGRLIFVPTQPCRDFGKKIIRRILGRWTPPVFCYHLLPGGHVAAARAHLPNALFVRMDIMRFYDAITRSKVHRCLRGIGIRQRHAFDAAALSTVSKAPAGTGAPYSLPFGFVQSPILATLALTSSALESALASIHAAGTLTISVYMDDIILSGERADDLLAGKASLEAAAEIAGFDFHPTKGSGPAPTMTVFNLEVHHMDMKLTAQRYAEFETEIRADANGLVTGGILSYVSTVNIVQHDALAALVP